MSVDLSDPEDLGLLLPDELAPGQHPCSLERARARLNAGPVQCRLQITAGCWMQHRPGSVSAAETADNRGYSYAHFRSPETH